MSEYVGSETFVALQKALQARQSEFTRNPIISNGGRIMNILDLEAYGWDNLRQTAEEDRFVGLTMVDRDATLQKLSEVFNGDAEFPYWQVYTGQADQVLPKCAAVLAERALPEGWELRSYTHPDQETIEASQTLNMEAGVAAPPAYYLRGEVMPSMLSCLYDASGTMMACASSTMRYHPSSPWADWMFAGGVSVHPSQRRRGLGAYLNAALLRDSHAVFEWGTALAQAKADNLPSVGMITKCGLSAMQDKVTIVVNLTGGYITR